MTVAELWTITISGLALAFSCVSIYLAQFKRFRAKVYLRPRIIITALKTSVNGEETKIPAIAVGCDISNRGAHFGAIEDMVLCLKYNNNVYLFSPLLVTEEFSLSETFAEDDFESFEAIPIDKDGGLTRYVIFGSDSAFTPVAGELALTLYCRGSERFSRWQRAIKGGERYSIDQTTATAWGACNSSFMLDAVESLGRREKLLRTITGRIR